jgi:lysophospholipase L1-like esterase
MAAPPLSRVCGHTTQISNEIGSVLMSTTWMKRSLVAALVLWAAWLPCRVQAQGLVLKPGGHLAIAGDSITEQKLYSRYMEDYLAACLPDLNATVVQLGWGGERAPGFAARMENDLQGFSPDVVTTCYGMNDGSYRAYEPGIGKTYEDAMRAIVEHFTKAGTKVVVGGPGVVDLTYFQGGGDKPKVYNENLAQLSAIASKIATDAGMPFADVHGAMAAAMEKARAALGPEYDVAGRDGVHPGPNGHLVMAYAFLKAMGCDGDLGAITVDLKGETSAARGHRVLSAQDGKVEIESSRYPFCFTGDDKSSSGTRSILPFVPFNQDLNRLTLVVKNLPWERATVTWGSESKAFAKADLEKGINLAAEFLVNPFAEAFARVDGAVAAKQSFETTMIKGYVVNIPRLAKEMGDDPDSLAALNAVRVKMWQRQAALAAAVKAAVTPVRHTLTITEAKP